VIRKPLVAALLLALAAAPAADAASTKRTAHGKYGQVLSASQATGLKASGQWVTVWGNHYNETIGIYATYCKVVPAGQLPTPCGAGIDLTGSTHTSVWISSNPPFIARPLVTPYQPGGRFKIRLLVKQRVGQLDCSQYKCAIATRSDHLTLTAERTTYSFQSHSQPNRKGTK